MKARISLFVSAFAMFGAVTTLAQCKSGTQDKQGCSAAAQKVAAAGCSQKACCGEKAEAALAGMPKMIYLVGDQKFCCEKQATETAKGDASKIRFVVGDETFDAKPDAMKAYANALDGYLNEITTVQYAVGDECVNCPNAAKALAKQHGQKVRYRLASYTFDNMEAAEKAARKAKAAAEHVSMTWAVGEKSYTCPTTAGEAAKQCGKQVEYCIGKTRTSCKVTAGVELAKAKIAEAVKVIAENGEA